MKRYKRRDNGKRKQKVIILSFVCLMLVMITGYAAFSTALNIGAKGNIVDKSRVIKSWALNSNEDFHTDFYRENIVSATFLDSAKVPSNKVDSWDVSVNKDGGVMAYVVESSSETGKYDLFIGAKDGVIANENSSYLFYAFSGLKNIIFGKNFDTSGTINMGFMFAGGNKLTSLDVSNFDTSNVKYMGAMFSAWNSITSRVENASLTEIIGLENFDTSNVTNMGDLFSCQPLTELDLSNFNTSNVTNMYHMFNSCSKLTQLNLCSFNTAKVKNMDAMFGATVSLVKIKVGSNWTTVNADTTNMFASSGVTSVTTGEC